MKRVDLLAPGVRLSLLALAGLTLGWPVLGRGTADPHTADGWYAAGQQALRGSQFTEAVRDFRQAAALNPSAANFRWLGEAAVRAGDTAAAAAAFDQAIARYRGLGDDATASALDHLAAPLRQTADLRLLGPAAGPDADPTCRPPPARLEPAGGLLLGTYVSESGLSRPGQGPPTLTLPAPGPSAFAVYFRYFSLLPPGQGEVFPTRFLQAVRAAGGAAHLAVEPRLPLEQVTEAYLLPFAQAARDAGVPIFLRFAGEMNDPANSWGRDPAAYRAAFVRVAAVMHRVAPNVAMVWMPMASRLDGIQAYYPGRDSVDWAGLSLYSVPFENGQLSHPNAEQHPTDQLEAFYRQYACVHPIQLSEYAASHRTQAAPGVDYTAFAVQQMREVYWGAMLHLPRVKNINWLDLDMNTASGIDKRPERLNDYRLFAVPAKLAVLTSLLTEPYFRARLSRAEGGAVPAALPWPAEVPAADLQGAVWVKAAAPVQTVTLTLDGQPQATEATLPYRFVLPRRLLGSGVHVLSVSVQVASTRSGQGGAAAQRVTSTLTRSQTFRVR